MNTNEWLKKTEPVVFDEADTYARNWALCADGFTLSIQTGLFCYSQPASVFGPFQTVEIACSPDPRLDRAGWIEGELDTGQVVYGHVPVAVLDNIIAEHGGIVGAAG